MPAERFVGKVENGKVRLDHVPRWNAAMSILEGQRVEVTIRRERSQRSIAQNNYWWAAVVPLFSEWSGYEKDEAHEVLKALFLTTEKTLPDGETVKVVGSTAKLKTAEFADLVERVARWLAGHGVYLPPPGQTAEEES